MGLGCGVSFTPESLPQESSALRAGKGTLVRDRSGLVLAPSLTGCDFPICKMGAAAVPTLAVMTSRKDIGKRLVYVGYRKWSVALWGKEGTVLPYSVMLGTESFYSSGALPQLRAMLEPVAGAWVASCQWDILPLVAALTALRISPYKVGPIKALSFSHQGPLESKAFQRQQFEHSN